LLQGFEMPVKVDVHDDATDHQERWSAWYKLWVISGTGFLAIFGWPRLIWPGRQETVRFPGGPSSPPGSFPAAQSQ
jgi:hypothetical protein